MEIIDPGTSVSGRGIDRGQKLQLEIETPELRDGAAHREEVRRDGDLRRERHEVCGVAEGRVQAFGVAVLTHEAATLAAHIAARKIEKSALDVCSHPIGYF